MQSTTDLFGIPKHSNPPRSEVVLIDGFSNGLIGIMARVFTPEKARSVGTDLTYVNNRDFGDYILVNTPGVYFIGWYENDSSTGTVLGITRNTLAFSTVITDAAHNPYRLAFNSNNPSLVGMEVSVVAYLNADDKIHFISNSNAHPDGTGYFSMVRMTQIST